MDTQISHKKEVTIKHEISSSTRSKLKEFYRLAEEQDSEAPQDVAKDTPFETSTASYKEIFSRYNSLASDESQHAAAVKKAVYDSYNELIKLNETFAELNSVELNDIVNIQNSKSKPTAQQIMLDQSKLSLEDLVSKFQHVSSYTDEPIPEYQLADSGKLSAINQLSQTPSSETATSDLVTPQPETLSAEKPL